MCLRIRYSLRSKSASSMNSALVTKICTVYGSPLAASSPRQAAFTGTGRTWLSRQASRSISARMASRMCSRLAASLGRKTRPVPYRPFSGTGIPCKRMNSWGIWTMIPAPSPDFPSAPSAPRWLMFSSTVKALSTNSCVLSPRIFTTIPTPQASCSDAGSYSPYFIN